MCQFMFDCCVKPLSVNWEISGHCCCILMVFCDVINDDNQPVGRASEWWVFSGCRPFPSNASSPTSSGCSRAGLFRWRRIHRSDHNREPSAREWPFATCLKNKEKTNFNFHVQSKLYTTTTHRTGKKWSLLRGGRYWEGQLFVIINILIKNYIWNK